MSKWVWALVGAVALILAAAPAAAFDTGPHAAITEQAMTLAGYNRAAADAVQVENWLTDYYTSTPTLPSSQQCYLEKLHFDDVFTDADVDAYWNTLLKNTIAAAKQAKANNDLVEYYAVLGISLHVVQDFYAHSNWVETSGHSGPTFETTTYFQWRGRPWTRTGGVHTGWYHNCLNIAQGSHTPHGGYAAGMNHDSVVRPNYSRAYVYALAASYEWLQQIRQAVASAPGDPQFATRSLTYAPSGVDAAALARDQAASLYVSEWISNPLDLASLDGHWNGNRSGYVAAFAAFTAVWTALPDSIFVSTFKTKALYVGLSQGLYQPPVGPAPSVSPARISGTVLDLRVGRVCANFSVGNESYVGLVTANAPGVSAYQLRDAALHWLPCTNAPWETLVFAPSTASSIQLAYALGNESGIPAPGITAVPIDGASGGLSFSCALRQSVACTWNAPGGTPQPMPASLSVKGNGFSGVTLSSISLTGTGLSDRTNTPAPPTNLRVGPQ
jgi:hypothetical protein